MTNYSIASEKRITRRGFIKLGSSAILGAALFGCADKPDSRQETLAWAGHDFFVDYLRQNKGDDFANAYLQALFKQGEHGTFAYSLPVDVKTKNSGVENAVFSYRFREKDITPYIAGRIYFVNQNNNLVPYRVELDDEMKSFESDVGIQSIKESIKETVSEALSQNKGSEDHRMASRAKKKESQKRKELDLSKERPQIETFAYDEGAIDKVVTSYMGNPNNKDWLQWGAEKVAGDKTDAAIKKYLEMRPTKEIVYVPVDGKEDAKSHIIDVVLKESTSLGTVVVQNGRYMFDPRKLNYDRFMLGNTEISAGGLLDQAKDAAKKGYEAVKQEAERTEATKYGKGFWDDVTEGLFGKKKQRPRIRR